MESSENQVCTGPCLQYGGGRRKTPQSFFFFFPLARAEFLIPDKAELDYSAVIAAIQVHKMLIGLVIKYKLKKHKCKSWLLSCNQVAGLLVGTSLGDVALLLNPASQSTDMNCAVVPFAALG